MDSFLFPDPAIDVFRKAVWDPNAIRSYDMMSGGFMWSDECWDEAAKSCMEVGNWAFRIALGYRASLICESPRQELAAPWDQLLKACPDWPGFRIERRYPALRAELNAIGEQRLAEMEEFDQRLRDKGGA